MDLKPRLERLGERVAPRTDAFDRLERFRAHRSRNRRLGTIALALLVAVAGSWGTLAMLRAGGEGRPAGNPTPSYRPSPPTPTGTSGSAAGIPLCPSEPTATLSLRAKEVGHAQMEWSVRCWNAPSDTPLTIRFHNKSSFAPGSPEGVEIVPLHSCQASTILDGSLAGCPGDSQAVFDGHLVGSPNSTVYDVGSLPAGTYLMYDSVHPFTHAFVHVR